MGLPGCILQNSRQRKLHFLSHLESKKHPESQQLLLIQSLINSSAILLSNAKLLSESRLFTICTEVIEEKLKTASKLLLKGLTNKSLYRPEPKLRNEPLAEELALQPLSAK